MNSRITVLVRDEFHIVNYAQLKEKGAKGYIFCGNNFVLLLEKQYETVLSTRAQRDAASKNSEGKKKTKKN